jgi:tryptophanyl-tRNA synthetase
LGGNPDVDVAYQYMRFFVEDDKELESIAEVCTTKGMSFITE